MKWFRTFVLTSSLLASTLNFVGPGFADDGDAATSDRYGVFSFSSSSSATSSGAVIPTTGSATVEAWVNPNTWATRGSGTDNYLTIAAQGQFGGGCDPNRFFFGLHKVDNAKYQVHLGISDNAGSCAPVNTFPTSIYVYPSQWTHIAVVLNKSSNTYQIYVDGEVLESGSATLPTLSNTNFLIGATSGSTDHGFTGGIDQVKVWNTALTRAQVQSSRLATDAAGISGIEAIYDFNEANIGSNLIDRARSDATNRELTRSNVTRTTKSDPTISISTSTGLYGASNTITASTNVAGKVTFKNAGSAISGCSNVSTSGSGSSHSATCTWTPTVVGTSSITVDFTPVLTSFLTWRYDAGATNLTVNRASQSITLSSIGTTSKTYPYSQQLLISTSGTSGTGAKSYSVADETASGCTLSSSSSTTPTLTATSSGTCLVTASIAQDANFTAATSSSLTFTFNRASQGALTISTNSARYGVPLQLQTTGGSGSGGVTYSVASGSATCTVSGDSLTASATGTCLVTATKSQDVNYSSISSSQTTVTFSQGVSAANLSISAGNFVFRSTKVITVSTSSAGKVSLKANKSFIPGCRGLTVNSLNTFSRTCSFKPMNRGYIVITATFIPTDVSIDGAIQLSERFFVYSRTGTR